MMELWNKALAAVRGGESKYKALVQAIMADIESGRSRTVPVCRRSARSGASSASACKR